MTSFEAQESAIALYDGGWRAGDLEDLIAEYDLTKDDAEMICKYLEELEVKDDDDRIDIDSGRFWLTCTGDGMAPTIKEGDAVLVEKGSSVKDGSTHVVKYCGETMLIRAYTDVSGTGMMMLRPDNPQYAPIVADPSDVQVIGLAVELRRKLGGLYE